MNVMAMLHKASTQAPFKIVELRADFSYVRRIVTLPLEPKPKEVFNSPSRAAFRASATELYVSRLPEKMRVEAQMLLERHWFEIHHIVPRAFGGSNDLSNLALVQRVDHDRAHEQIDRNTRGMEPGESREINLPWDDVGPGHVWWCHLAIVPAPRKGWKPVKLTEIQHK